MCFDEVVGAVAIQVTGQKAVQLELPEQAIAAKQAIAKKSSVVLLSDDKTGASSIVAEAMMIINALNRQQSGEAAQ